MKFLLGDATLFDWRDATMWFANSTCFDEELMRKLAVAAGASNPARAHPRHGDVTVGMLSNCVQMIKPWARSRSRSRSGCRRPSGRCWSTRCIK